MDDTLFVEQLETKIIGVVQEGLRNKTLSLARANEIAEIALSNLYPTMGRNHLLLAKKTFLKIPELKFIAEEIDTYTIQQLYSNYDRRYFRKTTNHLFTTTNESHLCKKVRR